MDKRITALMAALMATLVPQAADAQFPDLADLSVQYLPGVELNDLPGARAQVASYEVSLNVPIVLNKHTFLIPGLAYHADAISYAEAPATFEDLRSFHSLDLALLFVRLLPKDFSFSLRVAGGIAGDLQRVDARQIRLSFVGLVTHAFSARLVLGGGAIGSYAFGSFLPLPALYLDWKPKDALRIEGFLPAFLNVTYTIAGRFELGLRAEVTGNAYGVRTSAIDQAWPCAGATVDDPTTSVDERIPEASQCLDHVAYSVALAGPRVGVRLFSDVWLTAFAGYSFYRRVEQMNRNDDPIEGGDDQLPNTVFFRAALTWRLPSG
ncbi:MAG: hypothetical protein JRH20_19020 [Deltaproteobacteria bacterium]|nr:hypothetical protein [Deltaproteobacteria bacterium]